MAKIGYARVSTKEQSLDIQLEQLKKIGCEEIFYEKDSRRNNSRKEFKRCLEYLRKGDTLYITKMDRLGGTAPIMRKNIIYLKDKNVNLCIMDMNIFVCNDKQHKNYGDKLKQTMSDFFVEVLIIIADIEMDTRADRTRRGRERALARGVKFGVRPKLRKNRYKEFYEDSKILKDYELMMKYGISQMTIWRCKKYTKIIFEKKVNQDELSYSAFLKTLKIKKLK